MSTHSQFREDDNDITTLCADPGDSGMASGWVNVGIHALRIELDSDGHLLVEAFARGNEDKMTANQAISVTKERAVELGGVDPDADNERAI